MAAWSRRVRDWTSSFAEEHTTLSVHVFRSPHSGPGPAITSGVLYGDWRHSADAVWGDGLAQASALGHKVEVTGALLNLSGR